jgi:hypothetical protein
MVVVCFYKLILMVLNFEDCLIGYMVKPKSTQLAHLKITLCMIDCSQIKRFNERITRTKKGEGEIILINKLKQIVVLVFNYNNNCL